MTLTQRIELECTNAIIPPYAYNDISTCVQNMLTLQCLAEIIYEM